MSLQTNTRRSLATLGTISILITGCSSGSGDGLDENGAPIAGDEITDAADIEAPEVEAPVAEAPEVEAPVEETPEVVEAPVVEAPVEEAPEVVEAPVEEAPEVVETPVVEAPPVVSAFAEIQDTIFTPICSECHGPVAPSAGMRLDEPASFAAIVSVPSTEVPSLFRIAPGDPDNSYIIQKLEGTQAVGAQMPLGGPPLAQDTIDFVRQWITDGAPPATPEALALAPRVTVASVAENAALDSMPSSISIVWSSAVDAASFNTDTVSLLGSGGDGSFTEGNEIEIDVFVTEMSNPYVTTLVTANEKLDDTFQLVVVGEGDIYARAIDAGPIDGNADGEAGGNFVREFVVEN